MIRIAHISDLHFGVNNQETVWTSLVHFLVNKVQPQLVFVTGDITDSPDKEAYEQARKQLDRLLGPPNRIQQYFVCPGNHDRHWRGNAAGMIAQVIDHVRSPKKLHAWFDGVFGGVVVVPESPRDIKLEEDGNIWNLRILGVDSSRESKFLAQGHISSSDLQELIAQAKKNAESDLVILLQHHHLLPIMELESDAQRLGGLFSPTIMLNAGTVLESLAKANVNIVLHGHEHHGAAARYGALKESQSELVVVGAASGMATAIAACEQREDNEEVLAALSRHLTGRDSICRLLAALQREGLSVQGSNVVPLIPNRGRA